MSTTEEHLADLHPFTALRLHVPDPAGDPAGDLELRAGHLQDVVELALRTHIHEAFDTEAPKAARAILDAWRAKVAQPA